MSDRRGRRAEVVAAWWLRLKGYRILARRFATRLGEIDLIARRGRVVAFVEVKARPDRRAGLTAITPRQRRRVVRAAEVYLQRHPLPGDVRLRFDAVVLAPHARPRHLPGAFDAA